MGMASFKVYIDESGDEGFKFREIPSDEGSSDWFILAALVTRTFNDLDTVKLIDSVRTEFGLHPKKHVHWLKLKHQQKVRYIQRLAEQPVRAITVCVHKPSLLEPEKFKQRYFLYFYGVRYLLERISWLIRDSDNPEKFGGNGTADILFSNRQGMSYEEMKDYLRNLQKNQQNGHDIRIDFNHICIDQISALSPGKSMGLQLADAIAGATFNALERDRYGNVETRYLETSFPVFYRNSRELWGYGLKIVPKEALANVANEEGGKFLGGIKKR